MNESQDNNNLKDFVDKVCDTSHLRVESDLGDGFFRLRASEAQRRQAAQDIRCSEDIVIEMLRNSRDAGSKNIYLATNTENNIRNILIIDDGKGVPSIHHKTIFEPYVTSKLDTMTKDTWGIHGRGMALYSISVNALESYVVCSRENIGTSIYVKSDIKKLNEKTDQSSFPDFYINEEAELVIRGPKNIIRTACEFAVENRDRVKVYVGSPVDIAATLYNLSSKNNIKSIFEEPDSQTKLVDLLAYSSDVNDFKEYSKKLGIFLSKRTARRIIDGDISPQKDLLEKISEKGINSISDKVDTNNITKKSNIFNIFDIKKIHKTNTNNKHIKLSQEDKDYISNAIKNSFSDIAYKYYLNSNIEPKINIKDTKFNISFEITEKE